MGSPGAVSDVIVIGGGPAGSTIATLLAKQGHDITLFERDRFPREHVGESLLPYCYDIFDDLGVLDTMQRTMVRKPGVRFVDVDGIRHTTWCFSAVIKDPSFLSFHVRRDRFDHLLLRNSARSGVAVHEEIRVRTVDLDRPDDLVSVTVTGPDGAERKHLARFLVDASGRDTFMANRMGWKKKNPDLDRTALGRHWINVPLTGGLEEGLIQIVYLGGEKKGWIWIIPVGANRASIGVVVGSEYYRAQRQKLIDAGSEDWKLDLYMHELHTSPYVRASLAPATPVNPLMVNGDYSYKSETKFGERFAMVGDSHCFIDPIFSSGVYLSMNTSRYVFRALDPWLKGETDEPKADLAEAYEHIEGAYDLVEKAIKLFYHPAAINFAQAGSAADLIHQRHENALASIHFVLAGDFFDSYERYSKAIDLLADPDLFAKYKALVIDREGLVDQSTCHNEVEAFSDFLRSEVEPAPADVDLFAAAEA